MADFTFFTQPMSRGQIVRWALQEAGADYETELVDLSNKPQGLLDVNPMAKVPVLVHHDGDHIHVVTECAAICHYLAETHPESGLLPARHEKADYFRWLFFAAGPLEQAVVAGAMGWEVPEERRGMAGFGSLDLTLDTLDQWLSSHDHACGARFTMADVYLGSQFIWGLRFGTIGERASFRAYVDRLTARERYREATEIDQKLIAAAQAG